MCKNLLKLLNYTYYFFEKVTKIVIVTGKLEVSSPFLQFVIYGNLRDLEGREGGKKPSLLKESPTDGRKTGMQSHKIRYLLQLLWEGKGSLPPPSSIYFTAKRLGVSLAMALASIQEPSSGANFGNGEAEKVYLLLLYPPPNLIGSRAVVSFAFLLAKAKIFETDPKVRMEVLVAFSFFTTKCIHFPGFKAKTKFNVKMRSNFSVRINVHDPLGS